MAIQRILIVDDSATERYYLSDILTRSGYTVSVAVSGEEALEKLKAEAGTDPDGCGDAGRERLPGHALDRARSGAEGRADHHLLQQEPGNGPHLGLRQGARDYLVKPVDPAELLAKIAALG
jgi:twitching motility two-component system response regulator PilH